MKIVAFGSGYNDKIRTFAQKMGDFDYIEKQRKELNKLVSVLKEEISDLNIRRQNLISRLNNNVGLCYSELKSDIVKISQTIESKQKIIEEKRHTLIKLYYGYHERL